jgi:hypothetical protein
MRFFELVAEARCKQASGKPRSRGFQRVDQQARLRVGILEGELAHQPCDALGDAPIGDRLERGRSRPRHPFLQFGVLNRRQIAGLMLLRS